MDNKTKAAHLIMEFLPIVGQDPITGITTAKDCAKKAVDLMIPIVQEYEEALERSEEHTSELQSH